MNKVLLLAIAVWGAISVPLGLQLWQPVATPSAPLLPVFVAVAFTEGVAFGLGVHVLFRGTAWFPGALGRPAGLSLAWLFLNWWPHDGWHRSGFGQTFTGRAIVDVAFHVSVIAASVILAVYLARAARAGWRSPASDADAQPADRPLEAAR